MGRLTYEGNFCEDIARCDPGESTCGGSCKRKQIWEKLKAYEDAEETAMKRLGEFGKLFLDYEGCPRGPMGRAGISLEEEVLLMPELRDVDGNVWIPVNAAALHELVDRYVHLQNSRNDQGNI